MTILLLIPTLLEASFLPGCPKAQTLLAGPQSWQGFDLALTGMGPVDAGVTTSRYLAQGSYERCVLAGLAGGFAGRSPSAPALVEARSFLLDGFGVMGDEGVRRLETLGFPESVRGSMPLSSHEELESPPTGLPGVHALTVSASSATTRVAERRMAREPLVQIEEMEGFAVARACRLAEVPLTCLRAISNEAGDRDKTRWRVSEGMALIRESLKGLVP